MRTRRSTPLGFQPPAIGDEEVAAVAEALRSGWLTTGPRAALLEDRLAEYLEAEHVLAVSSGTAAMHLALLALDVGPGDEVVTSPITWPATANVIEHCGATPVFCDVREGDLNLDASLRRERRHGADEGDPARSISPASPATSTRSTRSGCRWSRTPRTRSRAAIGDASSAASPTRAASRSTRRRISRPARVGSSRRTADDVADRIRSMRLTRRGDGSRYDQLTWGFKANLSDVLAAIALVQLDKLERHSELRERQFALYDEGLADLEGIEPLARDPRDTHALHLYVVRVDPARAGGTRDEYQRAMAEERIATSIHFLPVHLLTWFRERYPAQPPLPVAERAGEEVLSLPLSPAHTDEDILDAVDAIRRVHARLTA